MAAMALNICEVMFWGRAFTARDRSARLVLAGVALIGAGVRVLLLLLGVMPGTGSW